MSASRPSLIQRYGEAIAKRDGGWICRYCGRPLRLYRDWHNPNRMATIDHVLPLSRGGSNELSNLALCCPDCNASKSDKTFDEWIAVQWKLIGRAP